MDVCNQPEDNKKRTGKNKSMSAADKLAAECAGCGDKNPEYVLDEKRLCFDCYRSEKYYWAKSLV